MKTTFTEPPVAGGERLLTLNVNHETFESLEAVASATGMPLEALVEQALVNFISGAEEDGESG